MKTIDQVFTEWESVGVVTPRTQLQINKRYLCLVTVPSNPKGFPIALVPFLHSDKDINETAAMPHYHIDSRFNTKGELDSLRSDYNRRTKGRLSAIFMAENGSAMLDVQYMTCRRIHPTGLVLCTSRDFNQWANKYLGKSCKGKKCPHWGMPMVDRKNGFLECPLHGLFGSSVTERIIDREQAIVAMAKGDPCAL